MDDGPSWSGRPRALLIFRDSLGVVLTCIFWALFFLPGYALLRRFSPVPRAAGLLYTLAFGFAGSLLVVTPVSLLCYASSAPLYVFSASCVLSVAIALYMLVRERADRELWSLLKSEPPLPLALLAGLLWLQARTGGWLDGDATFHLGHVRVLLEHGFTNRDIYLAEPHFQHVYHTNLLFPLYASLAQLTQLSYLETWFCTEPWAKLMVAAGHYVLGYVLTRQRSAGWLLALAAIVANAGETYTLYPNTLCVGFLLPMLVGVGLSFAARPAHGCSPIVQMAAIDVLLAQCHALYAVYAALLLVPFLTWRLLSARTRAVRWLALGALISLTLAAPSLLVSKYGHQSAITTAPDDPTGPTPPIPSGPAPGLASDEPASPWLSPALAAGGGHLEKVLDPIAGSQRVVFSPERMGGRHWLLLGFCGLCAAWLGRPGQRAVMATALLAAVLLALILFTVRGASIALQLLQTPFVVARLSTVLSSLLLFGVCASLAALTQPLGRMRGGSELLITLSVVALSTQLLGHAPVTFVEHVQRALAGRSERHALLSSLEARREFLVEAVPAGAVVIATARFARQVVMLRDCYVLAADRGHTGIIGIDRRRRDVVVLNEASTSWDKRAKLIRFYDLHWVVFEHRWRRRYRWAFEHGSLLGSVDGLDVVELSRPFVP